MGAADHRGGPVGLRVDRGRHDLPGADPAVPGEPQRVREGAHVHRAQHRRDARRLRARRTIESRNYDYTEVLTPAGGRGQQDHDRQRAPVGSGGARSGLRPDPGAADLLRGRRRRRRPLPHRRRGGADRDVAARGRRHRAAHAVVDQREDRLHPRLRRDRVADEPGEPGRPQLLRPRHPGGGPRHRRHRPWCAGLLRRAAGGLRHRRGQAARVQLPAPGSARLAHALPRRRRRRR